MDSLEAIESLLNAEEFIGNVKPDKRYAFLRLNTSMRRKIRQYGSGTVVSGLFYFTLGNVYKEMGLYEVAGREFKRSRNILQRTSVAEHIIDSVHEEEVQMYCLCGQNEDAYNWRLTCYEKYKNLYGEENPFTVNVRQNVAVSLEYMGKLTDALQIYKEIYTCRKKNEDFRDNIEKTARAILSVLGKIGDQKELNQYARIFLRDYKFFSMEQYLKLIGMIVSIPGLDVNFLIDVVTYIKKIKPQDLQNEQYFEYEQLMYQIAIILESGNIDLATELLEDTYQYRLQYYGEKSLLTIGCEMELILCRAQKGEHQLALEQLEKLYVKVTKMYDLDDISLAKAIRSNIAIERAILAEEDLQNKNE